MNWLGYGLGALLLYKWWIRWRTGYVPARWNYELPGRDGAAPATSGQIWLTRSLTVFTVLILGWNLISGINYRGRFYGSRLNVVDNRLETYDCVDWLRENFGPLWR